MMRERLPLYKVSLTSACFCFFLFSFTGIVRPSIRRLWKSSWAEWGKLQSTVQKSQILERAGATAGGLRGHCQMLSSSASGRLHHPSTLQLSDQGLKKKKEFLWSVALSCLFVFYYLLTIYWRNRRRLCVCQSSPACCITRPALLYNTTQGAASVRTGPGRNLRHLPFICRRIKCWNSEEQQHFRPHLGQFLCHGLRCEPTWLKSNVYCYKEAIL